MNEIEQNYEDFISTVSHELRTPLTSIRGFSQTMLASWDRLDEDSKKKFEECNKEFKEISENNEPLFSYGNAQKWVNMTIKNIYVVGALCEIMNIQHRFCEISKKFISKDIEKQLHIPIDNYILESIWNEENKKMWEEIEEEQKETQSDKSSLVKEIYCKNNKNKMKKYSADVVKPWSKWTEEDYNLFKKKFDENIKIPENLSSLSRWLKLFVQVVQKRSWSYRMDVAWI